MSSKYYNWPARGGNDVTRLRGGSHQLDSTCNRERGSTTARTTPIRSHDDGQGHRITRSRVLQGNRPSAVVESSDSRFPMRSPYGTSAQFRWKIRVVGGRPTGSGRLGGADAPIAALINKWGFDLAGGEGVIEELTMLDRPIVRCPSEERMFGRRLRVNIP